MGVSAGGDLWVADDRFVSRFCLVVGAGGCDWFGAVLRVEIEVAVALGYSVAGRSAWSVVASTVGKSSPGFSDVLRIQVE